MTEQREYEVLGEYAGAELRRYARCTVADVTESGLPEQVGSRAFRPLVGYITAENLAMTAPVLQQAAPEHDRWTVSFVLPGGKSLSNYPVPDDAIVTLREVPEHLAMATRWSGRWSHDSVEHHTRELRAAIAAAGMREVGPPVWARYDPPWKPWFLRRNEVLIEVAEVSR